MPDDDAMDDAAEGALRPQIRKKEFLDRAVERSGVRRGDARTAIEAALAELGEMLARGEELNLPPLGKLKVVREKDNPKAYVLTLRLVRQKEAPATDPLAEAAE